jgi:hypothetical protein
VVLAKTIKSISDRLTKTLKDLLDESKKLEEISHFKSACLLRIGFDYN